MTWSRQDYVDTAVARGMKPEAAEALADGLMREHARMREGKPGWQRLCMEAPMDVIARYRRLFYTTIASNPTPSPKAQIESGLSSVFGYGLFAGMMLGESGIGPNEDEREVGPKNLTEVFAWIDALRAEAKAEAEGGDDV